MSAQKDLTKGPLLPAIIRFALPVLLASLLQSAYGAVDLLIVGRFGDTASISAVGSGSEVMILATCIIMGLTMGSTVLIGQRIGNHDADGAGRAVGTSVLLFIILAVILTVLMELGARPLAALMKAPEEAFEKTVTYVRICSAGIVFIVAYNVIGGIFRGLGNSVLPMIFVLISTVVNIIGDWILCGFCQMDVAGAAIATIGAQAVSVLISFFIIRRQKLPFRMTAKDISFAGGDCRRIITIGTPLALQDALVHLSFIAVNAFANGFGLAASSGYAVGNRITGFLMMVPSSMSASVTAIVSQNVGAGYFKRARSAMKKAMGLGLCIGVVLFTLGLLFADKMAWLFTKDPEVIAQAALLIRGFAFDCVLTNILFCFIGYFNGQGKTQFIMLQGLTSAAFFRIPLSWFFSTRSWGSLFYLGLATPLTTVYGILLFLFCYLRFKKKHPERIG